MLLALVVLLLGLNWPIMKIGPGVYTVQVRRVPLEADAVAEASSTSHPIVVVSAQAPAMSESLPDALPSALQGSTARQSIRATRPPKPFKAAAIEVLWDLFDTEGEPTIGLAAMAQLPGGLRALALAARELAIRFEEERGLFDNIEHHAQQPGFKGGGAVTSFMSLVAELRGLGRAVAAIVEDFSMVLESEALARDEATVAVSVGSATWFPDGSVVMFAAPDGLDHA